MSGTTPNLPPLGLALTPLVALLVTLPAIIMIGGADSVSRIGGWILAACALMAVALACIARTATRRGLLYGLRRSASQILPAIPILLCIAMVSTTWMMSGVVPTLICYGLEVLSPAFFLVLACAISACISVLTGSSWTTIATIGVAFMGIGEAMGCPAGWVAGAVISGGYFGDKVSPLSETTVLAASTAGVELFRHIRYMMVTTVPSFVIALIVYACVGFFGSRDSDVASSELAIALHDTFRISAWTLLIPVVTIILILCRVNTLRVLLAASLLGAAGVFIFQPQLAGGALPMLKSVWSGYAGSSGNAEIDSLISTGGITGMLPTIFLVTCAMLFGAAMIGTGMLNRLTQAFTARLRKRTSIVGATVASGLSMNCLTADQYLSLIITGNMYRNLYRRFGLEPRLLSRAMEDAVSVTSVLIPWNSCGITQSTVLGVSTIAYAPFCVFNYVSPLMSVFIAWIGYRIPRTANLTPAPRPTISGAVQER